MRPTRGFHARVTAESGYVVSGHVRRGTNFGRLSEGRCSLAAEIGDMLYMAYYSGALGGRVHGGVSTVVGWSFRRAAGRRGVFCATSNRVRPGTRFSV